MIGNIKNPILLKTEQVVQSKVPPELLKAFQKIILAGSKVMYSKQTSDMLSKEINAKGDPAEVAGSGVAKLMGLLISQSKGTMPMKAAIPAATVLLCEGLSFMEEAGRIKVDKNVLAKAMRALSSGLLQLFGVTPDKLGQMMQKQKQQPPMGIVGKARGMA